MSNSFGTLVKTTIFGQSHSAAIGVVVDGLPAGEEIDLAAVERFMRRRAPGRSEFSTARQETDTPEVLSGLVAGRTCGAPLAAMIRNSDARSADYSETKYSPRPSHADFSAFVKYSGWNDIRGGGQFSGRLTAPLCFAGAVAKQFLRRRGITIGAQILSIAGVLDVSLDTLSPDASSLEAIGEKDFPVLNYSAGEKMRTAIAEAKAEGNSVGGVIRCFVLGAPAGLGEPMFDGLENSLARALFGIPAVKGLSFGAGFKAAEMRGSEHNDPFRNKDGEVTAAKNDHGGILGGISTGLPIYFDTAIKPTPSIAMAQHTVDLRTGEEKETAIRGRHDPCIVPRAVPCVEAAAALTILDHYLLWENYYGIE